jgi:YD repeat-containing protein
VTKTSIVALLAIGIVTFACSLGAFAQSRSCTAQLVCGGYSSNSGCQPPLAATAYACAAIAPFEAECTVNTNACAPAPECPNCNNGGAPINLANGDTEISETDVRIPGLGGGLTLVRTWNSIWSAVATGSMVGLFGPGWRSNFEESVYAGSDGYLKYSRGDGGFWSFGWTGQANNTNSFAVAGPASQTATLIQTPGNWTLSFKNGEQRVFDGTSGNLLSVTDRNGNITQLSYDASNRLVTVTDPASRHLYFAYASPSSYLVTGVTSDVGVSLSYSYDNQGRLVQYTKPDRTSVSFQYGDLNPTLVTAVIDSNGKVLESHTYDSQGRGLTSSRAGGVEAITVTYPPTAP